ncbi:MAG TPA: LEPR-XLL domain-containing protein [Burkholderiales bacterium]|nr:LEPR-XLL domain-containing protein [Burkholderiales bacterium]
MLTRASSSPTPASLRRPGSRPAFRRKLLFEALENRLMMSADPLASLAADGLLRLNLTQDGDQVVVEQASVAADGGAILDVTRDGITERYGDALAGVRELLGEGLGGDDSFSFVGLSIAVRIDGGAGSDQLFGPAADAEWIVSGWNSGVVAGIEFSDIENLRGAAGNRDTFLMQASAGVTGVMDGGAGGFDSLVVDGAGYDSITSIAAGPDSGTLLLDATSLAYAGLEPILVTDVPNVLVQGTAGNDDLLLEEEDADTLRVRSTSGTLESVSFSKTGLVSVVIDGLADQAGGLTRSCRLPSNTTPPRCRPRRRCRRRRRPSASPPPITSR